MSVKTSDLGGTDWSDGELLYSADLNDTFNAVTTHKFNYADTTEYTTTSGTFVNVGTATLSTSINAQVIGFEMFAAVQMDNNSDGVQVQVEVSGTNLGSYYLSTINNISSANYGFGYFSSTNTDAVIYKVAGSGGGSFSSYGMTAFSSLTLLDTTTNIIFKFKRIGSTDDVRIKNINFNLIYHEAIKND